MIILYNKREVEVPNPKNIKDIIDFLGLIPNTVISIKNGKIVEITEKVELSDRIEIIRVISGG